jgi:hypothetical protein
VKCVEQHVRALKKINGRIAMIFVRSEIFERMARAIQ